MSQITGTVASLHLHPAKAGEPLRAVNSIEAVAEKGLVDNGRYFGRLSRSTGQPSQRQVTLIEREQILEHATTLGLETISPGVVRLNIETAGLDLIALLGQEVRVGEAIFFFYEARTPCEKMDRICQGLRALMEERRQGVLARVVRGGVIRVGDAIVPSGARPGKV